MKSITSVETNTSMLDNYLTSWNIPTYLLGEIDDRTEGAIYHVLNWALTTTFLKIDVKIYYKAYRTMDREFAYLYKNIEIWFYSDDNPINSVI